MDMVRCHSPVKFHTRASTQMTKAEDHQIVPVKRHNKHLGIFQYGIGNSELNVPKITLNQ